MLAREDTARRRSRTIPTLTFLVIDEVGYLTYGPDAANVLFHVVNDRHLKKRPMIFTTNKPLNEWGKVLHDEDMAAAILDRVLERGRFIHLDGLVGRTRHLNLEETLPANTKRLRISRIGGSEFPEPTTQGSTMSFLSQLAFCGQLPMSWRRLREKPRRLYLHDQKRATYGSPDGRKICKPQGGRFHRLAETALFSTNRRPFNHTGST